MSDPKVSYNIYKTLTKKDINPNIFTTNCTPAQIIELGKRHTKQILEGYQKRIKSKTTPNIVIDYGCGDGRIAQFMAGECGELVCLDVNPLVIEAAKSALSKHNNIEFHLADDFKVPNCADLICSFQVLQHNTPEDQVKIMFHIYTLLKSGGIACVHFTKLEDSPLQNTPIFMCFTRSQVETFGKMFTSCEVEKAEFAPDWVDYYLWVKK